MRAPAIPPGPGGTAALALRHGSGGPWGLPVTRASVRRPGDEQMRVEPAAGVDHVRSPVDQPQRLAGPEAGSRRQDLDVERNDLAAPWPELPPVGEDRLAGGGPPLV